MKRRRPAPFGDYLLRALGVLVLGFLIAPALIIIPISFAGDVVTLSVAGDQQSALDVVKDQPFVREAKLDEGSVLLYVDRGEVAMPAILRLLDGAGLTLVTIGLHRPSLDDVFLRQTGRSLREAAA